jgi:hypothetical protein
MIVYTDVFSDDEFLSDAHAITEVAGNTMFRVIGKMITVTDDCDIGLDLEDEDDAPPEARTVLNLVESFHLQETQYDKKSFMGYIKALMKKILTHLEGKDEEIAVFKAGIQPFVKEVIGSFKEWQFFTGESFDPDASMALCRWETIPETGESAPVLYYFKHALRANKF